MFKWIMTALITGLLWASISGRMPELPPHIADRIETAKDVLQAVREPAQEAAKADTTADRAGNAGCTAG